MGGTGARAPKITRADVYRNLLEKYKELALLLSELEKRDRDLRRYYLQEVDKSKMEKTRKKITK